MKIDHGSRGMGVFMSNWTESARHSRQDFQTMAKALKDGDLDAAQDAYARLQPPPAAPAPPDAATAATAPANDARATLAAGMQAIGSALASGDLNAARDAFASLQTSMQAFGPRRHREPAPTDTGTSMQAPAAAPLTGQDGGATFFGIDVKA